MQSHVTADYLRSQGLSLTFPERFFSKIEITPSCWLWIASDDDEWGYGRIKKGIGRKNISAPRASWILHFGPIPKGMLVLHDCPDGDCPACVNPAHLWLGSNLENNLDKIHKGRDRNGRAKLSWEIVCQIRERWKTMNGKGRRLTLAKEFNVNPNSIYYIATYRTWKTIPDHARQ